MKLARLPCTDLRALRMVGSQLAIAMKYAAHCGIDGPFRDLQVLACPWEEIPLDDIEQHVHLWHGKCDRNSPYQNSVQLHSRLRQSECTLFDREGHISLMVNQINVILELLDES